MIVVGAGVAGLVSALELAEAGCRVIVLERDSAVGGCVRLHEVAGLHLDRGADAFATSRPAVRDLATRLGLAVVSPSGGGAWVRHAAGSAPLPARTLLGVPADPAAADVRRVIGSIGVARARLDRILPAPGAPTGGFGRLVRRRMGRRVLHRLVEPIVAGVYSTAATDLDVDVIAPGLSAKLAAGHTLSAAVTELKKDAPPSGSAVAGIVGGMGRLTEALAGAARAAGVRIVCGAPVTAASSVGATATAGRATGVTAVDRTTPMAAADPDASLWQVTVTGDALSRPDAPGRADAPGRLTAPTLVIATPPADAAALIDQATAGALALPTSPPTSVAIVTLVVDCPALDGAPRGTGVLVSPQARDVAAKALTHVSAKWSAVAEQAGPGRHVLRLSFGRGDALPSDDDLVKQARRDAALLLSVALPEEAVIGAAVVHYPDQLTAQRGGHVARIAEFRAGLARFPGLAVVGAAVAGTGLAGVVTDATTWALAMTAGRGCTIEP